MPIQKLLIQPRAWNIPYPLGVVTIIIQYFSMLYSGNLKNLINMSPLNLFEYSFSGDIWFAVHEFFLIFAVQKYNQWY